jgi:hypothetical protein
VATVVLKRSQRRPSIHAVGLRAYHTWLLVPRDHGTYVVMEEIGLGDGAQRSHVEPGDQVYLSVSDLVANGQRRPMATCRITPRPIALRPA